MAYKKNKKSPPPKYRTIKTFHMNNGVKTFTDDSRRIYESEIQELLKKQDYKCAICKKQNNDKLRLCVDHNHFTGQVRGMLCSGCNFAIGLLRENLYFMKSAIDYIIHYQELGNTIKPVKAIDYQMNEEEMILSSWASGMIDAEAAANILHCSEGVLYSRYEDFKNKVITEISQPRTLGSMELDSERSVYAQDDLNALHQLEVISYFSLLLRDQRMSDIDNPGITVSEYRKLKAQNIEPTDNPPILPQKLYQPHQKTIIRKSPATNTPFDKCEEVRLIDEILGIVRKE